MAIEEPTLLFFRNRPDGWARNSSIASSLQSIESSFFLLALRRYPHALSVCVSAIESSLQAANIGASETDGLQKLVIKAKKSSQVVNDYSDVLLKQLRETRNRITHRGFSPQDDSEAVNLYLSVGLPFLSLCYSEFHNFDLLDGLLTEYARHISVAQKVLALAKIKPNTDLSYSSHSFGHLLRWSFKETFSTSWEIDSLVHAEEVGVKFKRMHAERQRIEGLFDVYWSFDCPVCDDFGSAVAEIDSSALDNSEIEVKRIVCTNCGFVVSNTQPHLSQTLLHEQISESRSEILSEYGFG